MVRHTGEDFVNVESVAKAAVLSPQSPRVDCSELDAPETNRFAADDDSSFGQDIFDVAVTEVESIVEPDCVTNDIWRKPVTFICVHHQIISFPAFNLSVPGQLIWRYPQ